MIQPDKDSKNGVQSLEIGLSVARVLVNSQGPMMLKDIALQADMPPAKAHRYLVSLIRAGMVIQDPATSHYDLGPFALNIGLAAVNRIDRIRLGLEAISRLRNQINETTALAVWSANGPVIVRWERPRRPITVNVVTGVSVELLNSASGLVFSAWLPERRTSALIQAELARQPADAPMQTMADVQQRLAEIREKGIVAIGEHYFAGGVQALGAPVFNFRNEITMVMVVVGIVGMSDLGEDSMAMHALREAAQALSRQLGSTQPDTQASRLNHIDAIPGG